MTESREIEIIKAIKRGLADVEAGRVVPHEEAMAEIYAAIERTRRPPSPDVDEP